MLSKHSLFIFMSHYVSFPRSLYFPFCFSFKLSFFSDLELKFYSMGSELAHVFCVVIDFNALCMDRIPSVFFGTLSTFLFSISF